MQQFDDLKKPINKTETPYNGLKNHIATLEKDFAQFYENENQTAGVRVRKGMQALKRMAQEIRVEVKEKRDTYKLSRGQI